MSLTRNPAKQILKIFREVHPSREQHSFLYLNFHCDVDSVKYDCNLDPAKSEIVFERIDLVCTCFRTFLDIVYGTTSVRSHSPEAEDFFPCAQQTSRLPSPPQSSPVVVPSNVRSPIEDRGHAGGLKIRQLRQTRLDEYRGRFTAEKGGNEPSTTDSEEDVPGLPIDTTIRAMMTLEPEMDGIDLTHGIVSSRQPRLPSPSNPLNQSALQQQTPDIPGENINNRPASNIMEMREFAKKFASPSTPLRAPKSSPTTPRSRKPRNNVPPPCPETPPPIRTPIKTRSISESPGHTGPTVLETSLNPWTIAATTYRSPQRSTIASPAQTPAPNNVRRSICEEESGVNSRWNPWTIAALVDRSSKRRRVETATAREDEMEMDPFLGDMELHMVVMVCDISMAEIATEVSRLVRCDSPPACDLMEFLLQRTSS